MILQGDGGGHVYQGISHRCPGHHAGRPGIGAGHGIMDQANHTHTHTVSPIQAWLLVILAVGIVVSLVSWVPDPGDAPLPWDMSKAHPAQYADGRYPGHRRLVGSGGSVAGGVTCTLRPPIWKWRLFRPFWDPTVGPGAGWRCWAGWDCWRPWGWRLNVPPSRPGILGLLLVGANGLVLSLSGQRMLDFPGAVAAVLALAGLSRLATRPSWRVMVPGGVSGERGIADQAQRGAAGGPGGEWSWRGMPG